MSQQQHETEQTQSLTLVQAVRDGLYTEMSRDEDVVVMGEDVGENGGVFRATQGLIDEFGGDRVIDTPLAESGIIGTAIGMAAYGLRPVPEMQFLGFTYPGAGPDREPRRPVARTQQGPVHLSDGGASPVRRRHPRTRTPLRIDGGLFCPPPRSEGRNPLDTVRHEGAVDRRYP
ncbi:MAG: transketolase, pyrimidine binding domain protein [halophilic archaeon J07HX64]|jgi:Pyruvate/2-oxoglutarate dehydrogenase complex, dehydrogenase (E1) component, eukaryotic type, beta subunit|nr:MAG: transketolase, pyrimidine binding domain protein [halophilic archaeon J07HX64]